MRRRIGELWIGLGVLHFLIILLLDWNLIGEIVGDGYVNAVGSDEGRNAAFWLFFLGAPFIIMGVTLRWAVQRVGTIPESMGWTALIFFLLGALAVPTSGFWLGVALAAYGIVVARQDSQPIADLGSRCVREAA